MFFGGVCQFISGIMEFVSGNTVSECTTLYTLVSCSDLHLSLAQQFSLRMEPSIFLMQ
jgi:succinate-acetate transporter protein